MNESQVRSKGITLIELLVAIAIIMILAAIAFPIYDSQMAKSRRTDGRAALQAIALAQERYYTINGTYTANVALLDLKANLQDGDSEAGHYNLTLATPDAANRTFTITATPKLTDSDCTSMTVNQIGVKGGAPATNKCW